ncbi:hypothetical protein [Stappia sp.]|uniref:hypothetical protein n=1 Tax=Stappia sp. TaxID=1870903 RepID=UPI003C7DBBEA
MQIFDHASGRVIFVFENPTVKIFLCIGILILIFVLLDFLKLGQHPTLMEDNPIAEAVATRSSGTIRLSDVELDGRSDWDLICLTGNGGEVREEYRQFSFKVGAIQEESLWSIYTRYMQFHTRDVNYTT